MKYEKLMSALLCLLIAENCGAQRLAQKTNEVFLATSSQIADSGPLPVITWRSPDMEFTSSEQNKLEIRADVEARGPLRDIRLVVGNNADGAVLAEKKFPVTASQRSYPLRAALNVPDGNILLTIEAITDKGSVVTEKRQVLVGKEANESMVSVNRKDYILVFATDKYDHWDDLVNPVHDAQVLSEELKVNYGFAVDLVENPTVERIWEKLREYNERKFSPQDQLMIFFAGHGHYDESFGEGFVVAKNSLNNDLSRTTYLSHNRLRGVINNIACNHILLTMDVCFGGTLDPVIARSRGAKENEVSSAAMLVRKWSHKTRKYLTSGGKEYVSDGVRDKHSPFAGKMIETLRTYGGDDGILTLSELQGNLEKMSQLPRFGAFGEDEPLSDFVFVRKR